MRISRVVGCPHSFLMRSQGKSHRPAGSLESRGNRFGFRIWDAARATAAPRTRRRRCRSTAGSRGPRNSICCARRRAGQGRFLEKLPCLQSFELRAVWEDDFLPWGEDPVQVPMIVGKRVNGWRPTAVATVRHAFGCLFCSVVE